MSCKSCGPRGSVTWAVSPWALVH
ncbi:hypothetical protein [Futiania mangrovi]